MDNLQITSLEEDSLIGKCWKALDIFASAYLPLREWVTTSSLLLEKLEMHGLAAENQSMVKLSGNIMEA